MRNDTKIVLWQCSVGRCRRPRVAGTGYCSRHATLDSRAVSNEHRVLLWWALAAGTLGLWALANASPLLGSSCKAVAFSPSGALAKAFVCAKHPDEGSPWLSGASGGTVGALGVAFGFAMCIAAIVILMAALKRMRGPS